jgi:hypothetical protein
VEVLIELPTSQRSLAVFRSGINSIGVYLGPVKVRSRFSGPNLSGATDLDFQAGPNAFIQDTASGDFAIELSGTETFNDFTFGASVDPVLLVCERSVKRSPIPPLLFARKLLGGVSLRKGLRHVGDLDFSNERMNRQPLRFDGF